MYIKNRNKQMTESNEMSVSREKSDENHDIDSKGNNILPLRGLVV